MAVELPAEVQGTAAGVLVFSFAGLICNGLVIWLTWVHRERLSHMALISYILFLSTASCISSQMHFYVDFNDVMTEQWRAAVANPRDPQMIISNGAQGVDLGLWYFRQYAFSASAMLVVFWAFALLQSVYGWESRTHLRRTLNVTNIIGKIISITLPIITICLLQAKAIQKSLPFFMFLANVVLMISLAAGSLMMVAILVKYILSRRELAHHSVVYIHSASLSSVVGARHSSFNRKKASGVYDKWLMMRFTIAFVVLSIFELTNMLFQFTGKRNLNGDLAIAAPDLSAARARQTTLLYLPGPAPSLLLFVVFGTTSQFRQRMHAAFVPRRWQKKDRQEQQHHQHQHHAVGGGSGNGGGHDDKRETGNVAVMLGGKGGGGGGGERGTERFVVLQRYESGPEDSVSALVSSEQDIHMVNLESGTRRHPVHSDDDLPILPPSKERNFEVYVRTSR
ncbi:hypothetical protein BX600DRAFT_465745 [Xylariales sp. PMI_506]|nr:hypothetical protein BX600DRAFT_465745 [Xylariales sp. PMI_506]